MSAAVRHISMRRIVVALDASRGSLDALQAASELALRVGGALIGLFVEDVNLVRLASFPFARAVGAASFTPRSFGPASMERLLRAHAEEARRALAAIAAGRSLEATFEVRRGGVAAELLAAGADLLVLGRASGQDPRHRRLGSTAERVLNEAAAHVLLTPRPLTAGRAALVSSAGSASVDDARALAGRLFGQSPVDVPAGPRLEERLRLGRFAAAVLVDLDLASPETRAVLEKAEMPVLLLRRAV